MLKIICKNPKRCRDAIILAAIIIKQMVASPSLLLFKKVVNWGLTPQAINFAQSAFMGHRVCFSVPVDLMNEYFTWTRASGELRPTGRFVAAPTTIANLPTFATAIERCLGAQYTDLDGVAEGLNYSSSALDCTDDMKRDPCVDNKTWDYSSLPASIAVAAPAATHYGANDLVMAFVLNKCFGSSSFDAYNVVYNLDDGFGMLTSEQLAAAINLSMQEEENLASLCVLPAKAVTDQLPGDNKGQVDAMFRSLLSIDAQRFHKNGRQITGLFETNTDADASGNWCLTVGDKIEVPVKLYFRSPVTVLSVVDGAQNASSATPDQVETVFIKGEAAGAAFDAHDPAQAAAADRGNVMAVRLQLVCSAPAISSSSTRSTSEVAGANLAVVNKSSLIFYKGSHYPTQSALAIAVAGGAAPYTYAFTASGTLDQVTSGAALNSPPGVALSSSGSFSFDPAGISAVAGRWKANVTITDAASNSVSTDIYVTVDSGSSTTNPPPLVSAPTKPASVSSSSVSSSGFTVSWSGGAAATSYTYSLNGNPATPSADNGVASKSATFSSLQPSTSYSIVVTAVNAGGSAPSDALSVSTLPPPPPSSALPMDVPRSTKANSGLVTLTPTADISTYTISTYTQETMHDQIEFNLSNRPGTWSITASIEGTLVPFSGTRNSNNVYISFSGSFELTKLYLTPCDPLFPPGSVVTFVATRSFEGSSGTTTVTVTMPMAEVLFNESMPSEPEILPGNIRCYTIADDGSSGGSIYFDYLPQMSSYVFESTSTGSGAQFINDDINSLYQLTYTNNPNWGVGPGPQQYDILIDLKNSSGVSVLSEQVHIRIMFNNA